MDCAWREAYAGRTEHPPSEAEKVAISADGSIARIGKRNVEDRAANGEFIGMVRLTGRGADCLVAHYEAARRSFGTGPFQSAADLASAYLTDLLQQIISTWQS